MERGSLTRKFLILLAGFSLYGSLLVSAFTFFTYRMEGGAIRIDKAGRPRYLSNKLIVSVQVLETVALTGDGGRRAAPDEIGSGIDPDLAAVQQLLAALENGDPAAHLGPLSDPDARAQLQGLDLSFSRRFVELHGGSIRFESEPSRRSRFFFTMSPALGAGKWS